MKFRPIKAFIKIALAAAMISACQQQTITSTPPTEPTQAGGKPAPETERTKPPVKTLASPASTPTPDNSLDVDFNALRDTVVTFWHPWQGEVAKQIQTAADTFNRTNEWGLKVQVQSYYSTGALFDAVNETRGLINSETRSSGKTPAPTGTADTEKNIDPDLVAATTEQLAAWALIDAPVAVDLMPYINDPQAGLSDKDASAYLPVFWEQDRAGEMQFGLPALRTARVLFYNQSWAKDLGFSRPPQTSNEFKQQACAAAVANNTSKVLSLYGTGGWVVDTDPLTTLSWLAVFGADPLPEAEGQPYHFQSDEAEEALAFLRGMVDDGCAWLSKADAPYETFAARKALFYSGTLADLPMQIRWQELQKSPDSWLVMPFPGEDGKPVIFSSGYSYGILQSTPEKQLGAWLFARWLSQPEVAMKLAEALPSLPVTNDIRDQLAAEQGRSPWNQVLPLSDGLRAAPGFASWRQARRPLEDAAWQIYHLPPDGLLQILPQLDLTVEEILNE